MLIPHICFTYSHTTDLGLKSHFFAQWSRTPGSSQSSTYLPMLERLAISSAEANISGVIRNMERGSVVEHETPHQARVHATAAVGVYCRRLSSSCCTTWPSGWRPIDVNRLSTIAPPAIRPALDAMHVEVFLLPRSKQVKRPIIVYWCHSFAYNCLFPIQK